MEDMGGGRPSGADSAKLFIGQELYETNIRCTKKNIFFWKILSLFTVNNFLAVSENIHDQFSTNLKTNTIIFLFFLSLNLILKYTKTPCLNQYISTCDQGTAGHRSLSLPRRPWPCPGVGRGPGTPWRTREGAVDPSLVFLDLGQTREGAEAPSLILTNCLNKVHNFMVAADSAVVLFELDVQWN